MFRLRMVLGTLVENTVLVGVGLVGPLFIPVWFFVEIRLNVLNSCTNG